MRNRFLQNKSATTIKQVSVAIQGQEHQKQEIPRINISMPPFPMPPVSPFPMPPIPPFPIPLVP